MIYERLKKGIVTLALSAVVIFSAGIAGSSTSFAQDRYNRDRHDRWDRRGDRDDLDRIRRLDWQRQVRYRWNRSIRVVGYHDRFGRFHVYGYYDRFGRFHRY